MPTPSHPAERVGRALSIGCGGLFGGAWILFWSVITLTFDVMAVRGIAQQSHATRFPTARGTVVSSEVKTHTGSKGSRSYTPVVRYAYTVNNVRHESDQLRYGVKTSGRDYARGVVASHPPGREVTVYYDPASPGSAVLEPGVAGGDLFMLLFLTPFNVIMLGGWVFALRFLTRLRDPTRRLQKRIRYDGTLPVVRLPRTSPLLAAGVAALASSFVLIFVVGFATRMAPSIGTTAAALGVVLIAAVAAAGWAARPDPRRHPELAVDPIRRRLTLPLGEGQYERETVRFDQVTDVTVERKVSTGAKTPTPSFVPTLHFTDGDPNPRRFPIAKFHDEAEARALCAWLADQLTLRVSASDGAPAR